MRVDRGDFLLIKLEAISQQSNSPFT